MPLILPGNVASATASTTYDVANSCRFNDGDAPRMYKTQGDGNQDKWTFSCWFKRGALTEQYVFRAETDSSNYFHIRIESDNQIYCSGVLAGSNNIIVEPSHFLRDVSAWYHIVLAVDTGQAVAANRVKWWINGTQVTSFSRDTYPDQNADTLVNDNGGTFTIGSDHDAGVAVHFDGYMAEVCLIDNAQLDADSFGEFDSDSPAIWKPIDVSGLTFGTNGFYLDFEASDNLGNDANGGTDLTESGLAAIDQCSDSPTNNFCTWNSASDYGGAFSEGNTKSTGTGHYNPMGTFGMAKGKWYWECYLSGSHITCGVGESGVTPTNAASQTSYPFWIIYDNGGATYKYPNPTSGDNITAVTSLGNFADGVTVGLAFDADAKKLWASFNGTYYDGGSGTGDPAAGTNELFGSVEPQFGGTIVPACGVGTANSEKSINVNFGNPSVSISSGNADANGYGNFEFAVPRGFYALCTKNLAEYG